MIVQAANPQYYAEMVALYKAARPAMPSTKPVAIRTGVQDRQIFLHVRPDANHHVKAWEHWQKLYNPNIIPSDFVRLWCGAFGVNREALLSSSRTRELCRARVKIAKDLVARYPGTSTTKLGKLLNRDHTSVLYFLGKTKRAKEHLARQASKARGA